MNRRLALAYLMCTLLLAACGGGSDDNPPPDKTPDKPTPRVECPDPNQPEACVAVNA